MGVVLLSRWKRNDVDLIGIRSKDIVLMTRCSLVNEVIASWSSVQWRIQKILVGGIWSQNLKNSDVFTKIETDFSAEIGNSNVFFLPKIRWSPKKKKKKVFTKIKTDFSAEIGNSNVFFAQNQVVSKKKKKKKKRSSPKLRLIFRPKSEIQTFFSPKIRWSPKKKKKRSSPKLRLIFRPDSLRLGRWGGMHPEMEPNYSK